MRSLFLLGLLVCIIMSCQSGTDDKSAGNTTTNSVIAPIQVLYFHLERRCPSCIAIEDETKKILADTYDSQVKAGTITFREINVDEEQNQAIAEKYQIAGSALLIIKTKDGKEEIADLTGDGFKLARNMPDMFREKLSAAIDNFLK